MKKTLLVIGLVRIMTVAFSNYFYKQNKMILKNPEGESRYYYASQAEKC